MPPVFPAPALLDRDLEVVDPEIAALDRRRASPTERRHRADRLGELGLPGRARSAGLGPDQQVRRGLPGQALLRRMRVRRRGRAARDRPGEGPLLGRARQRPAALGLAGQHGRLHDGPREGRQGPRHGPLARRPSHPRPSALLLGPRVRGRRLRRAARGRTHRLRGARRPRARAPAEAHHRGRVGVRARDRLREIRSRGRRGRGGAHVRHRAHRRSRDRRPAPLSRAPRAVRDDHDPQDAAGPARRPRPLPRRPGEGPRPQRLPRHPGRTARARDRGEGRGVRRGGDARVRDVPAGRRPQRPRARGGAARAAASASCPEARTTT